MEKLAGIVDYPSAVGLISSSVVALALWLSSMLGPLKSLADYVDPAYDSANATHHSEARRQIEKMIEKITRDKRRLVLFVDDLERSPERTLEVLDILEGLFSMPNCVVVMPTDLEVLGDALEQYSKVRDGRKYLEKYVQLRFDMPSVENSRLVDLLMRGQSDAMLSGESAFQRHKMSLGRETIAGAPDRIDEHICKAGVTQLVNNSQRVLSATRWNLLVDERKQRALPETEIYKNALRYAVSLAGTPRNSVPATRSSSYRSSGLSIERRTLGSMYFFRCAERFGVLTDADRDRAAGGLLRSGALAWVRPFAASCALTQDHHPIRELVRAIELLRIRQRATQQRSCRICS